VGFAAAGLLLAPTTVRPASRWLAAIAANVSERPLSEKVIRHKPANLADGGWAQDASTIDLDNQVRDLDDVLRTRYPVSATPRIVAANGDRQVR
jgi:hypothetical protein